MSKKPVIRRINRREFVRVAAAAGGLAFVGACGDEMLGVESETLALGKKGGKPGGGKGGPTARYPLKVPDVHEFPGSLTLNCGPTNLDLGDGQMSDVWAYNGSFPGPTLRARRGDNVNVILQNNLPDETITHWHGMVIDHLNDGHPMHAIQPASSKTYDFKVNQRAALNWYHPHPHGLTGEQVNLGLAGAFIIEDNVEAALGLPAGAYEVPLIIRDAKLDRSGNLTYTAKRGGFSGDTFLVNGTLNPALTVNRALYRFRVLNGSNARIYRLALDAGQPWLLIGNDGGLLANAVGGSSVAQIDISPGERLDLLIDFRGLNDGHKVMLQDLFEGWDLLEFAVSGNSDVPVTAEFVDGQTLSTISPLVQNGATRTFSFDGMSRINGQQYEMDRIDERVPVDSVEKWIFTTNGNAPHPVHVHAAPFQVLNRTGGRNQVFPWERGWKDTVLLEDGETVEVLVYFKKEDYLVDGVVPTNSIYLMHCHKLEHEDMGMMMNWELYDPHANA